MNGMRIVTTVCTGNLCRSPMAAALLDKHLTALGVRDVLVQSAGLQARAGQGALSATRRAVEKLGADLSHHRTSEFDSAMLEESTLVLCAAGEHLEEIRRRWPDADHGKLHLFNEPIAEDAPVDVEDPIGFDDTLFLLIARVIDGAMEAWAESLVRSPWRD